jgi:hypothetical protein
MRSRSASLLKRDGATFLFFLSNGIKMRDITPKNNKKEKN